MSFTVNVWRTVAESANDLLISTNRATGITFSTSAQGGFTDAAVDLTILSPGAREALYQNILGAHLVIFDRFQRRVYEGRVTDRAISFSSVKANCLGYYAHGKDLTHGMIYPAGSSLTPTKLITDTIDIAYNTAGLWSNDYSNIMSVTMTFNEEKDFTQGKKLSDALDEAVKLGDGAVVPSPAYIAIWENRKVYFYTIPTNTAWLINVRNIADPEGISRSTSRENVWNKIQVIYNDPIIGQAFTNWAEDKASQAMYGIREGTMNIGDAATATAEVIRDLAIAAYAYPEQELSVRLMGWLSTPLGAKDNIYMLRAGQKVTFVGCLPTFNGLTGATGSSLVDAFIDSTTYDATDMTMNVTLGKKNQSLSLIMSRLGTGSSDVS